MRDFILRILGWRLLLIHGEPSVLDRWLWVRKHLKGGPLKTFDPGCGNGVFSMYAALAGNRVLAASFAAHEQDAARGRAQEFGINGIDFRILDLRELESERASLGMFDQIICLETIEHLSDDEGLVRSLSAMLEPGGQLLLSTPYDRHHPTYTEDPHPSGVEDGSHVRFGYSQARLREIFEAAGLEVSGESFVSGLISQKVSSLMRWLAEHVGLLAAWMIVLPLRPLVVIDEAVTQAFHYPHMCIALRGVKPADG
jgi:SAM-dependent methyltransferase